MTGSSRVLRFVAASLVFGSLCFGGAAVADDDVEVPPDPNHGFGPNNRPAFLLVSVTDTFEIPELEGVTESLRQEAGSLGSRIVRVNLGNYVAGDRIETTRFAGLSPVLIDLVDLPPVLDTDGLPSFDEHQFTILGSFRTFEPDNAVHMMTPYPGAIPQPVQQAFFNASVFFDDPEALPKYPTTVQMALFVYDHQGDAGASIQDILDGMFAAEPGPALELVCHSPCESEGTIFPHDPDADGQFLFHSLFDPEGGVVSVDICLPVSVDVKPGNSQNVVNAGSEGVLWVAVLTTDDFDAVEELDPSTFEAVSLDDHVMVVSSVPALDWDEKDVDHDGDLDLRFKFSVPALSEGSSPPLSKASTSVHFRGDTQSGMCIEGFDNVQFVPKKKK